MVVEKKLTPLWEWLFTDPVIHRFGNQPDDPAIGGHLLLFALIVAGLTLLALLIGFLTMAFRYGPAEGFARFTKDIRRVFQDLILVSPRRVYALARLAVQESWRRRVIVVFVVFCVLLLFAGWFLDRETAGPARLYISFVMQTTTILMMVMVLFLSAFSLPTDIKNRTIYTVTTKPVRLSEIILGRMVGFGAVSAGLVALLCVVSYVFVVRGLMHGHEIEADSLQEVKVGTGRTAVTEQKGQSTFDSFHRHEITIDADGRGRTDVQMQHRHAILPQKNEAGEVTGYAIGPPEGMLDAKIPFYGTLTYLDRGGVESKGINVGHEWTYRMYIEGGTQSAAIWTFDQITPERFPKGLPLEWTLKVYRSHKGNIERGIRGRIYLRNPETGYISEPLNFMVNELSSDFRLFERRLKGGPPNKPQQELDLFELVDSKGRIEVWVKCDDNAQYLGMAQADMYLKLAESYFYWNFIKGFFGIWMQTMLVVMFGVMLSTFLSAPVAMLTTLATVIIGWFAEFVFQVSSGQVPGGGPIESLNRLVKQMNTMTELDPSAGVTVLKSVDTVTMALMQGFAYLMPDYSNLTSATFVAEGYNIPMDRLIEQFLTLGAYGVVTWAFSYLFLRSRELAS